MNFRTFRLSGTSLCSLVTFVWNLWANKLKVIPLRGLRLHYAGQSLKMESESIVKCQCQIRQVKHVGISAICWPIFPWKGQRIVARLFCFTELIGDCGWFILNLKQLMHTECALPCTFKLCTPCKQTGIDSFIGTLHCNILIVMSSESS